MLTWGQIPGKVRWALSQAVVPGVGEIDLDLGPEPEEKRMNMEGPQVVAGSWGMRWILKAEKGPPGVAA